ncbi:MAG TPA: hypothetical protein VKT78_06550 [Fimbriimonadaceae bacterium]|nr:hypothetical protein [Fimbriimonadaceae bacterium]
MAPTASLTCVILCSLTGPMWNRLAPQEAKHTPFVCNIGTLTVEERSRLPEIIGRLLNASPTARELPNGYELTFAKSDGLFPLATEWLSAENRCCRFFDISIKVARDGGPMSIRLTGPEGVKAFIADDLPKLHELVTSKGNRR